MIIEEKLREMIRYSYIPDAIEKVRKVRAMKKEKQCTLCGMIFQVGT